MKELCRRAVLEAIEPRAAGDTSAARLTKAHLTAALDDLLDHSPPVLRSLLGANPHLADTVQITASPRPMPGTVGGWVAFAGPTAVGYDAD